jgi:hypothetical protein
LCWLTRRAAADCNLQNYATGDTGMYACIHNPHAPPYVCQATFDQTIGQENTGEPGLWKLRKGTNNNDRNQWCVVMPGTGAWYVGVNYSCDNVKVDAITNPSSRYNNSFSTSTNIVAGKTFYRGPFQACYAVWQRVGSDPANGNSNASLDLNQNWRISTTATQNVPDGCGYAVITLKPGYSTVYFPFIKATTGSIFPTSTQINMKWEPFPNPGVNPPTPFVNPIQWGYIDMGEFPESTTFQDYNPAKFDPSHIQTWKRNQPVNSAMISPVVCFNASNADRNVKVILNRNLAGPALWIGRPIVLSGACSWHITQ